MPLRPPSQPPQNQRDWDRWARAVPIVPDNASVETVTVADKAITNAKLRDSLAVSVIGRASSSGGQPSDIAAGANDTFLMRRTNTLEFTLMADSDVPATIARQTDISAAIAALEALTNPFPQYVLVSNVLTASATYDPPSLADGAGTTTTVTCTGAALGDFALASFSLDLQGITVSAYVSSANTVSVRVQNESGGALDLASGTLRVRVWKQ